jgi:hypothetical protein
MELEVTHLAVLVIDLFLLVYCSPACHRAEDVVAHVLRPRRGLTCLAVVALLVASSKCQLCLVAASEDPARNAISNSSSGSLWHQA